MDNAYFICKNSQCHTEWAGGEILTLPESDEEQYLTCPTCKQKYFVLKNKSVLTVFDEEPLVFESLTSFSEFLDKMPAVQLDIRTLHLKNITDSENFGKIISFKDSYISELIIEGVDLQTSCFPIVFDGCHIVHLKIINTSVAENEIKDFWGPHNFYSVNFNDCKFYEPVQVENYEGDLMFRGCDFDQQITITDSRIDKLHFLNNKKTPELKLVNTDVRHHMELNAVASEPGNKVRLKKQDKVIVSAVDKGKTEITGQHIKHLIFPADLVIDQPVLVSDCIIEQLTLENNKVLQKLQFINCRFLNDITLSQVNLDKAAVFEACNFDGDFTLNEMHFYDDLHLSYSTVAGNLNVNHSTVHGYMTMHLASVEGRFVIDHSEVYHNTTLVNLNLGSLNLDSSNLKDDFFFKASVLREGMLVKYSILGRDINISNTVIEKSVAIESTRIEHDLQINNCMLFEEVKVMLCEIRNDVLISGSFFFGDHEFNLTHIGSNIYVASNSFFQNSGYLWGGGGKVLNLLNNVMYHDCTLYKFNLQDHKYDHNYIFGKLDMDDVEGDDLSLSNNQLVNFEVKNLITGRFESSENAFGEVSISELFCNKQFTEDHSTHYNVIRIENSKFVRSVSFDKVTFKDNFWFEKNNIGDSVVLDSTYFSGEESNNAHLFLSANEVANSVHITGSMFMGKVEIFNNNLGQELEISHTNLMSPEIPQDTEELVLKEKGCWIRQNNMNKAHLFHLDCTVRFYFEDNLLRGRLRLGDPHSELHFSAPVSVSQNRMREIEVQESDFEKNACFLFNHVEGKSTFSEVIFEKNADLTGTYTGGSAVYSNVSISSTLILDRVFFDKRVDFVNSKLEEVSFNGATLNGFNMPDGWKMLGGKLCNQERLPALSDERLLEKKFHNDPLTYPLARTLVLDDEVRFKSLKKRWREIKSWYYNLEDKEKVPQQIYVLLYYADDVHQMLKEDFFPLFYGFIDQDEKKMLLEATINLATELNQEMVGSEITEKMKSFCADFSELMKQFISLSEGESSSINVRNRIKPLLYERLQDQYLVIKEIYGGSGELGDEDRAYFRWMHFKNLFDMNTVSWLNRPSKWIKWLVFENIFGWGVDLFRIFGSTILLVLLFSVIYWIGGQLNSSLFIQWDETRVAIAALDFGNIILLTFQTTFAAFMGDWSPAGLGPMKIWMTVNAVLGVLLVAFLIGAYGRKMLR
ncbi:MAG: hypothetical protein JXR65_07530 [Bacteroidales bacterium]|nr:hypothetical protein [Bacteroidales bacterium]